MCPVLPLLQPTQCRELMNVEWASTKWRRLAIQFTSQCFKDDRECQWKSMENWEIWPPLSPKTLYWWLLNLASAMPSGTATFVLISLRVSLHPVSPPDNTFALPTEVFSSCLAIVSAVTVGGFFIWPALVTRQSERPGHQQRLLQTFTDDVFSAYLCT